VQQRFAVRRERVEAGRDQRLDVVWNGDVLVDQLALFGKHTPVTQHPDELLGVEGVSSGSLEESSLSLCGEDRLLQERGKQARGLVGPQRGERDRVRVPLAAAPTRVPLVQLRPGAAEHEQRDAARPVDEVFDESDQCIVGPVEILEDQHEWPRARDPLDETTPGGERLLPLARQRCTGTGKWCEACIQPVTIRGVFGSLLHCHGQFGNGFLRRVRLEDSRLSLHHFSERPVRDSLAIGERASLPPEHELGPVVNPLPELGEESCLADARFARHRHELHGCIAQRSRIDGLEEREVVIAADQRCAHDRLHVDAKTAARRNRLPQRQRLRFAFHSHGLERFVLEEILGCAVRGLADDDPADGG
jgi:hypothetical protein